MKNKLLILLSTLLVTSIGYSQYNYEIKLESLNGIHPKVVLNDISKKIDIFNKHYEDGVFLFESQILLSEEQFTKIMSADGFTIDEFEIKCKKEGYLEE